MELPPVDEFKPTGDGRPPLGRASEDWRKVRRVDLYQITREGCVPLQAGVPVTAGKLTLALEKEASVAIVPAGTRLSGRVLK